MIDPVADLAALNIDSPRMRWLAARDYIQELRDDADRAFNRIWLIATFLDYAEENALRRGAIPKTFEEVYPPGTQMREYIERTHGEGPHTLDDSVAMNGLCIPRDYFEAAARALEPYKGEARKRGAAIIANFMPWLFKK